MSGGCGHNLLLALEVDHRENKIPSFGNELTALFCSNQRDIGRRWYLWYPVKLIDQSKNYSVTTRLIHCMPLPQLWLA